MAVDVSKAAVDARRPKRAADTAIGIGLLSGAAAVISLRVVSGSWAPLLIAIVVFGLGFAAGHALAKASRK